MVQCYTTISDMQCSCVVGDNEEQTSGDKEADIGREEVAALGPKT